MRAVRKFCSVVAMHVRKGRVWALVLTIYAPIVAAQDNTCPVERQVTVTIQANPAPSLPGQSVRFNVFVAPVTSVPDPTGPVQLLEGTNDLGTFPLMLGQVSTVQTFYSAGARAITANYSGDFNYCGTYGTYGQPVDRITPSVALSSGMAAAVYGAPLTFLATVAPDAPSGVAAADGPVQLYEGTTLLGTGALASGKATLTTSALGAGSHKIVATLVGDANWYSVRSAPLTVTINRAATTTQLSGAATQSQLTLTAAVAAAPPGAAVQEGTVQFTDTTTGAVLGSASVSSTLSSATLAIANSAMATVAGHLIAAAYSGSGNFIASTSSAVEFPGIASAAGVLPLNYAADQIVSLFGAALTSPGTPVTATPPLSTALGGTSVTVTDSAGTARKASLYLVSPQQINFVMPSGTAQGTASVAVATSGVIPILVKIGPVSPGLFDPGAQILRIAPDGSQTLQTVTSDTPIAIGSGPVYLVLYGTGIRNRSSLSAATVAIGSLSLPAAYAGAQPQSPGLDQVNVLLPADLAGAGKVNVILTVDGQASNSIVLNFQ